MIPIANNLIHLTLSHFFLVNFFHNNLMLPNAGKHNLTLMFNSIETKERLEEDAVEHGNQIPLNEDRKSNEKVSYK